MARRPCISADRSAAFGCVPGLVTCTSLGLLGRTSFPFLCARSGDGLGRTRRKWPKFKNFQVLEAGPKVSE
ncbi:MAG: hypothetical protein ABW185_25145 [Sedimenticola sp.]